MAWPNKIQMLDLNPNCILVFLPFFHFCLVSLHAIHHIKCLETNDLIERNVMRQVYAVYRVRLHFTQYTYFLKDVKLNNVETNDKELNSLR